MDRHNCTDTIPGAALSSALSLSWQGWLNDGKKLIVREIERVTITVRVWRQRRRARHALTRLDDRLLRDIGFTREHMKREIQKPFWRP